jgi:hypothetical protein
MQSIRLNTYWDSIEPARVQREPQRAFQFPDQTPGNGPETHSSEPTRYPGTLADGCPKLVIQLGLQYFADVRMGRMLQRQDVLKRCERKLKGAGADSEPSRSRPRRRRRAINDRWRPGSITFRESLWIQLRPGCSRHQGVWSGFNGDLTVDRLQCARRLRSPGSKFSCGLSKQPGVGDQRRF